jgi:hypothetical protein
MEMRGKEAKRTVDTARTICASNQAGSCRAIFALNRMRERNMGDGTVVLLPCRHDAQRIIGTLVEMVQVLDCRI